MKKCNPVLRSAVTFPASIKQDGWWDFGLGRIIIDAGTIYSEFVPTSIILTIITE